MTGLVGWWPLNEYSGSTAYDLSGNDNHGSLNGGIIKGVAGKGELTSYSFDGTDDYVGISDDAIFDFGDGEFTVSLWVRKQNNQRPIAKRGGANSYFDCTFLSDGTTRFLIDDESTQSDARGSVLENGKWYHIVGVVSDNDVSLYVDGALDASVTNNTGNINNNQPVTIGYRGDSYYLDGEVCDVRIYVRALSSEEVRELYDWGGGDFARPLNDSNSSSAVSRWAFDGNVNDVWESYSSSDETSSGYESGVRVQAKVFEADQNDFVSVNSGNSLSEDFASSGLTVSSWVKTTSTGARKTIWAGNGANAWWDTRVNENERPEFWYANSGQNSHITASETVENSEWYHLAFVCRPSDYRLSIYMNGAKVVSGGNGNNPNAKQFSKTSIGDRDDDEYMDGSLDDLRIYSKALSPSEVFELYRWGTRGRDMRKLTVNSR